MINTPTADVKINAKDQKNLDAVRNLITTLEAEVLRLQTLKGSEEYSISELHKEKTALTTDLPLIKEQVEEEVAKLNQLLSEFNKTQSSLKEVKKAQEALAAENDKSSEEVKNREVEVTKRENAVTTKEEALAEKLSALKEGEQKLSVNVTNIKEAINKI